MYDPKSPRDPKAGLLPTGNPDRWIRCGFSPGRDPGELL